MRTMTSRFAVGVAALAAVALPGGTPAGAAPATATDEACLMQATTGRVQCYPSADALLEAVTGEPAEGFSTADLAAPATVAAIEAGLADYKVEGWLGTFVAAGTPAELVERISSEIRASVASPEISGRIVQLGGEPTPTTPAEFTAMFRAEVARWAVVVKQAKIATE